MLNEELLIGCTPVNTRRFALKLESFQEWDDFFERFTFAPEFLTDAERIYKKGAIHHVHFAPEESVDFAIYVTENEEVVVGIVYRGFLKDVELFGGKGPSLDILDQFDWNEARYFQTDED